MPHVQRTYFILASSCLEFDHRSSTPYPSEPSSRGSGRPLDGGSSPADSEADAGILADGGGPVPVFEGGGGGGGGAAALLLGAQSSSLLLCSPSLNISSNPLLSLPAAFGLLLALCGAGDVGTGGTVDGGCRSMDAGTRKSFVCGCDDGW